MAGNKKSPAVKNKKPAKPGLEELAKMRERQVSIIKSSIEKDSITTLSQVIDVLRKTPLANMLGHQGGPFGTKLKDPTKFTVGDILKFSQLFKVSEQLASRIFLNEARTKQNTQDSGKIKST
jgi:hypothetical protein